MTHSFDILPFYRYDRQRVSRTRRISSLTKTVLSIVLSFVRVTNVDKHNAFVQFTLNEITLDRGALCRA